MNEDVVGIVESPDRGLLDAVLKWTVQSKPDVQGLLLSPVFEDVRVSEI